MVKKPDQKAVAIIPARIGSKRIPKKNIFPFMGKPLLVWAIESALDSGVFDRVLVSTDSEEVGEIGRAAGAECPFLRDKAYGDHDKAAVSTIHSTQQLEAHYNESYDVVFQLMANCPLRTAQTIRDMYDHYNEQQCQFLISVFSYGWINPWWAIKKGENGQPEPVFPKELKSRSQDLPNLYCPTGAIWIADKNALFERGDYYGPTYDIYDIGWKEALDIDDYSDLEFAEAAFGTKRLGSHETG